MSDEYKCEACGKAVDIEDPKKVVYVTMVIENKIAETDPLFEQLKGRPIFRDADGEPRYKITKTPGRTKHYHPLCAPKTESDGG